MNLSDLISLDAIIPASHAQNKKAVLLELADKAAELTALDARLIFEALQTRERLGSTSVGRGIAVPHGRIAGLEHITCAFARLAEPIAFGDTAEQAVDLVFLLLTPEHAGADHLKALSRLSRLLREPQTIEKLRGARDRKALFAIMSDPVASHAA